MLKDRFQYVSDNLIIRFYQPEDFSGWQKQFNDMNPKQNQWDWEIERIKDLTKERFDKKLALHSKERKDNSVYYFCIQDNNNKDLVGISILNNIHKEEKSTELGFQISNKFWKKGFGKNVAYSTTKLGFEYLNLETIIAKVNKNNFASLHILEQIGFKRKSMNETQIIFEIAKSELIEL